MTSSGQTRAPSDIARESFRVVFDERNLSDPYRFWTDESVMHFMAAGESVRGAEALAQWFRELLEAVPDWRAEIENTFDDGARQAVVQWRGAGIFTGAPFMGIQANGRRIEIRAVDVFRFDGADRVEKNTVYFDGAEFARQIGMLPPRGSALDRAMLAAFNARTRLKRRLRRR
jgi:steroid delta-isomerase-like uncharacterized protein